MRHFISGLGLGLGLGLESRLLALALALRLLAFALKLPALLTSLISEPRYISVMVSVHDRLMQLEALHIYSLYQSRSASVM